MFQNVSQNVNQPNAQSSKHTHTQKKDNTYKNYHVKK